MNSAILRRILRRDRSLFQEDMVACEQELRAALSGARMLVIGAAGSIGSAFVREVVGWGLGGLRLVDPCENNLVELVRDLRASAALPPEDFATSAIAMGSVEFDHYLAVHPPFDYVVNFAALKHVRAERDPFTLMRMLHVNVLALDDLLKSLAGGKFFSVSSDKAVNPANLMGASKALMEAVMWHHGDKVASVTSRFANVAFSDGSLLHGFLRRVEKRQPIAAPMDIKRYFISHQEAGQLCLLAAVIGRNQEIFIPGLNAEEDLSTFAEIAVIFLEEMGYTPRLFDNDHQARAFALAMAPGSREWPCRFSPSDTTGEKDEEEFLRADELVDWHRFARIGVIGRPAGQGSGELETCLYTLRQLREQPVWKIPEIIEIIKKMVPALCHVDAGRNLDGKM